jgi:hypothetical protein
MSTFHGKKKNPKCRVMDASRADLAAMGVIYRIGLGRDKRRNGF